MSLQNMNPKNFNNAFFKIADAACVSSSFIWYLFLRCGAQGNLAEIIVQ